jgi:large subunit ribosomal protein L35
MPKMKTNKGAMKRFRRTKTGKVKRMKAFASHIFTKKPRKRKRHLRQATLVAAADTQRIKRLMPYT